MLELDQINYKAIVSKKTAVTNGKQENRAMDNVQKHNNYINTPLS
jgi:hypothetical protein